MNTQFEISSVDPSGGIIHFKSGLRALIDNRHLSISSQWLPGEFVNAVRAPEMAYLGFYILTVNGKGSAGASIYRGNQRV